MIKKKIEIFFFLILFLILSVKFNFFLNGYIILKNNIQSRLIETYGYCYPQAYGFIKYINEKYDLNNKNIKTSNREVLPSSEIFTYSNKKIPSSYEILINYNKKDLEKINNKFRIIDNKQQCYLIEHLND